MSGRTKRSACAVDDCDRPTRRIRAAHCEMHYYRLRRTGSLELKAKVTACGVEGCHNDPMQRTGMCRMHALRMTRRGDVTFEYCGPANHAFSGDDIGYGGVHTRLSKERGSASRHRCVDCSEPARHWSYDHQDPDEKTSPEGRYSTDLDHYQPRCVPCHKRYDLDRLSHQTEGALTS